MDVDIIQLNRLLRIVSDAEQSLVTMAEGLQHARMELERMRKVELARLDTLASDPLAGECTGEA